MEPRQQSSLSGVANRLRVSNPATKLHKLAQMLEQPTPESLYRHLVSPWRGPLPLRGDLSAHHSDAAQRWPALEGYANKMMAMDAATYLPDDILAKVDRAAMAASLETRVPFLDPRVIEFAWRLPMDMKIRNGQGKWLLRQLWPGMFLPTCSSGEAGIQRATGCLAARTAQGVGGVPA